MFKSKIVRAILIVLLVVIVLVAAIVIWQYENISAFIDGVNLDEEQINQKVEQAHQDINDTMTKDNLQPPRAPTKEEEDALNSKEITQEEFTKILTNQTTLEQIREDKKASEQQNSDEKDENEQKPDEQKPVEQKPSEQKPSTQKPAEQKPSTQKPTEQKPTEQKPAEQKPAEQKDYETLISEKVAELYAIKANYYAEFNAYWASAKAEFLARPVEEHTQANVAAVVRSRMSEGFAMEDRYDVQVDQVVSELTELLKAAGRDTALATSVKNAYISEKKAEKARIIAKYFG